MQLQSDKSHLGDEVKTQFRAREGYYKRLMNLRDYSQRSQRNIGFTSGTTTSNSSTANNEKTSIRISLVTIKSGDEESAVAGMRQQQQQQQQTSQSTIYSTNAHFNSSSMRTQRRIPRGVEDKKICFNIGRELFVYNYDTVKASPDSTNLIYKRTYKGPVPTCHDFNQATATSQSLSLIVGFSHGQVQLIDLNSQDDQEVCKEFNLERLIDKTRVTCVRWLPDSPSLFLVAHASGQLYLYKDDLPCGITAPTYQIYKQSDGVIVYTCKTKVTRNPIYKWTIGAQSHAVAPSSVLGSSNWLHSIESESYALNEFVFSPCAKYLACVSQDGFLRVYCYDTMELVGRARSYYGGLTCVCWSPDGKYVVTGGEDDLITVWSFVERRVIARGLGHKSWVSVVSFDSFYSGYDLNDTNNHNDDYDDYDDDDDDTNDHNFDRGDEDDDDSELIMPASQTRSNVRDQDGPHSLRIRELENLAHKSSPVRANKNPMSSMNGSKLDNSSSHTDNSPPAGRACFSTNERADTDASKMTSYRFGSVGQDTLLCMWDLNDDLLKQPVFKSKLSQINNTASLTNLASTSCAPGASAGDFDHAQEKCDQLRSLESEVRAGQTNHANGFDEAATNESILIRDNSQNASQKSLTHKVSGFTKTFSLVGRRDKRNMSQKNPDKNATLKKGNTGVNSSNSSQFVEDPVKLLGSPICPRMNEVPLFEPAICKKISSERLTSLIFCKNGFLTACQDGSLFSWARPPGSRSINNNNR